ncbi:hypothetical protein GWI33_012707 [Rhynchophorus ferrugineus]|uniref:Uncharacterized protein n=1 Tax=Rhynchophorus ferrugineus TaxID=354439 RepID=A0A834M8J2_RHYFE|nr:hypothetical protein GWI33_012707 [Rhynchophorus ferrugineus]
MISRNYINHTVLQISTGVVGSSLSLVLSTVVPPEHAYWVVPFLCFESIFLMLSMVGGSTISGYDLSPTFAPIVYGVAGTCSDAVGLFGPLLETWLISDKTAADEWRLVFIITALVASVPSIAFVLFASDKRQDWGDIEIRPAEPKPEISVIGESTERKDNEF